MNMDQDLQMNSYYYFKQGEKEHRLRCCELIRLLWLLGLVDGFGQMAYDMTGPMGG